MDATNRSSHRRTRSLDLQDSLQRIEALRQRRQQFLDNRAKFNVKQSPPSQTPPPVPRARPQLTKTSSFTQATDQLDSAETKYLSPYVAPNDKTDEFHPLRPVTPISALIQGFTAEILNLGENDTHNQPQSSSEVYLSDRKLDDRPSSTIETATFEPVVNKTTESLVDSVPFKPPNWIEHPYQNLHSDDEQVSLRRPSEFWKDENPSLPSKQLPYLAQSTKIESGRAYKSASLQMPMSITDPEIFQAIKHSPQLTRKAQIPQVSRPIQNHNVDVTDARTSEYPSWIPVSQNSDVTSSQASRVRGSVTQPPFSRSSSFQGISFTERGNLSDISTSNLQRSGNIYKWRNQVLDNSVLSKSSIKSMEKTSSNTIETKNFEALHSPQIMRRFSSNSLTSFPRRSQTPTIPVKSLVQKFSSNK
ncbi:hypothetical protein C0J52_05465 [Blattella germanica]|nr:hypothetical protein C0J52_05465 [Blattella germanica]